ncbi:MAG TPA: hypothetical protein VN887_15555 [Candidatus Angelobacter sp.]|nr:hypothetical protein [Candidatus Angelobacter sp.]
MEQRQQDEVVGRLVRERAECNKNIAALQAQLANLAELVSRTGQNIEKFSRATGEEAEGLEAAVRGVQQLELLSVIADLRKARERRSDLLARLKDLGV